MEFMTVIKASKDNQHYLVLWIHPSGKKEFVVCSYYDEEKEMGSRWCWGHYFNEIEDALEYWNEEGY